MARERPLAELLREAFRRSGLQRGVRRAEAVVLWRRVVGPDVARFSRAVALQQATLVVDVPDPETALHLGLQRHHLLRAYAEHLGPDAVREIRFRVGRAAASDRPQAPAPRSSASADPRAVAALARRLQDVPEALAGTALQAGASLLALQARRRAEGWQPCAVCDTLHEPHEGAPAPSADAPSADAPRDWCPTCRRMALLPRVTRQAARLAAAPDADTPSLSDDERLVARALAAERAAERALALLPQALADPSVVPDLEHVARAHAALVCGLSLDQVDDEALAHVDPRILRALGRWSATRRPPPKEPPS